MRSGLARYVVLFLTLAITASPASAQRLSAQDQAAVVWTIIIPEGFPKDVFTWRLKPDGTYEEEGREVASGRPIQPALTGRWTLEGSHMVLRQTGIPYVFDGTSNGEHYSGTLYLSGRPFSTFCAVKGALAPSCAAPVAMRHLPTRIASG
jgi:hypothetical protein